MTLLIITRFGTRFDIETGNQRLHVLTPQSLAWNLVCTYGFKKRQAKNIIKLLETKDTVTLELVVAA